MHKPGLFIRRYPVPLLFAVSLLAATALLLTKAEPPAASIKNEARRIDTRIVTLESLSPSLPVFVKVTSPQRARLRAAVTADVVALHALEGAQVSKGEVIVQLDSNEPQLIVEQRRADVLEASAQIDGQRLAHENRLFVLGDVNKLSVNGKRNRNNIIKEHRIKLAQLNARLIRAKAALELAQLNLERARIRAPFNGRITKLHVSNGDRVRPGDLIVDIYDNQAIELRGPIATRYIETIQSAIEQDLPLHGQIVVGEKIIPARLERLSGEMNERSGSVDVIFTIGDPAPNLQLGRAFRLDLKLPPVDDAFHVPPGALYGNDTIYKVVNNRLKSAFVTRLGDFRLAGDASSYALLRSSEISSGDQIMVTQLPNAVENLPVQPIATARHKP